MDSNISSLKDRRVKRPPNIENARSIIEPILYQSVTEFLGKHSDETFYEMCIYWVAEYGHVSVYANTEEHFQQQLLSGSIPHGPSDINALKKRLYNAAYDHVDMDVDFWDTKTSWGAFCEHMRLYTSRWHSSHRSELACCRLFGSMLEEIAAELTRHVRGQFVNLSEDFHIWSKDNGGHS